MRSSTCPKSEVLEDLRERWDTVGTVVMFPQSSQAGALVVNRPSCPVKSGAEVATSRSIRHPDASACRLLSRPKVADRRRYCQRLLEEVRVHERPDILDSDPNVPCEADQHRVARVLAVLVGCIVIFRPHGRDGEPLTDLGRWRAETTGTVVQADDGLALVEVADDRGQALDFVSMPDESLAPATEPAARAAP
jgi:hypothetical protein